MMAGVDLVHVPYHGSYMPDLIAGQTQLTFTPLAKAIEFIKAGKLGVLAVAGARFSEALPDVPALAEFVPVEYNVWHGAGASKGTPADVIKLNIKVVLAAPKTKERFAQLTKGTKRRHRSPSRK